MSDESGLKSKLLKQISLRLPGFIALRHEDVRSSGIPDLSLTGFGRTSWWEFKHAAPTLKSKGIQELTMLRLAGAGFARYVVWEENKHGIQRTLVVHPKNLVSMTPEEWFVGYDHKAIVEYMRKVHR